MSDIVQHLLRLGLTEYEAKAYVATTTVGEGTVREISEESGVPRPRVYKVMERLAERGLVEIGNTEPVCYRAVRPQEAMKILMEGVEDAANEAASGLEDICSRAQSKNNPIWTVKGELTVYRKLLEYLESARGEVVLLFFSNKFLLKCARRISEVSEKKSITVIVIRQPETFIGLLGKANLKSMIVPDNVMSDGQILQSQFSAEDGTYNVELMMMCDRETSVTVSKEGGSYRAIMVNGTIMGHFQRELVKGILALSTEVTEGDSSVARPLLK